MRKLNEEETELFISFADVGFSGPQSWVLFALAERIEDLEIEVSALRLAGEE